jgi:hypothetical protein
MQQLDLFADRRDLLRVNEVAAAIADDRLAEAGAALALLQAEFPGHAGVGAAAALVAEMRTRATTPFDDVGAALAARDELEHRLAPAAQALLGADDARRWLTARLRELADRAQRLPWHAPQPRAHAAGLYAAAGAWAEALAAATAIASWRRQPQPLAWAAEASWRQLGADAGWPLLAELAWLAPARAAALLTTLAAAPDGRRLARWLAAFEAELDGEDQAWFPAWLLVEQPLLAGPLAPAQPHGDTPPERAFKTLLTLLRLEREGRQREVVAQRRVLRELHPALFACYLKTR